MYSHCLYCRADFGRNESLEAFPVGRRLAFDEARGRLWVVCGRCTRWSLSPIEERWEAIEACERVFRAARRRVNTENIGLAALPEGLELVRVGRPQRPELAAWRYGRQLLRRRRRHHAEQALNLVWFPLAATWVLDVYRDRRLVARATAGDGRIVEIRGKAAAKVRLRPSSDEHGWLIAVPHGSGFLEARGAEAVRLAGLLLPRVNRAGAQPAEVDQAVREIEAAGGAEPFFRVAAQRVDKHEAWALIGRYDHRLTKSPATLRLAIEMAAHEESERRALEGELAVLEDAWRDAEEIAAIADNLVLPQAVLRAFERIRRAGRGSAELRV